MYREQELAKQFDKYVATLNQANKAKLMKSIFSKNHNEGYHKMIDAQKEAYARIHRSVDEIINALKKAHPIANILGLIPSHENLVTILTENGISYGEGYVTKSKLPFKKN